MGVLLRAGWRALRRRLSRRPGIAAVRAALRGQPGIGRIRAVEVSAAEHGGALLSVELGIAEGVDAREAVCRAADRLRARWRGVEICVSASTRG